MFFEQVRNILEKNNIGVKTSLLLACSGGRDSMSLAHFFLQTGQNFALAHCNFQLRAAESDGDEQFIATYANEQHIPFFHVSFETAAYAKAHKISIQEAARQLRYDWLESIRKENAFHYVITAHHANDNLETVLMNFTKGCGLKGLSGITPINQHILRPLLQVPRKEIDAYIHANHILFRDDASNEKEVYTRNFIRKSIIPNVEKINPAIVENSIDFVAIMKDADILLEEYAHFLFKKNCRKKGETQYIALQTLREKQGFKTLLFYFLKETNPTSQQLTDLYHCIIKRHTDKQFLTNTHRLILDRNTLLIQHKSTQNDAVIYSALPKRIIFGEYKISVRKMPIGEMNLKSSPRYAFLDAEKIKLPLKVRNIEEGDYFYPFGMGKNKSPEKPGKKKIAKFFKDLKLNQIQKENIPILFSGEHIIWVVGQRIDQRFAVTSATKEVICFTIVKTPEC